MGSLLPNGHVSVPENMDLLVGTSVAGAGKELVRNAASCDNQVRLLKLLFITVLLRKVIITCLHYIAPSQSYCHVLTLILCSLLTL